MQTPCRAAESQPWQSPLPPAAADQAKATGALAARLPSPCPGPASRCSNLLLRQHSLRARDMAAADGPAQPLQGDSQPVRLSLLGGGNGSGKDRQQSCSNGHGKIHRQQTRPCGMGKDNVHGG